MRSLLGVLKALAGSDVVKLEVIKEGGIELVLEAVQKHLRIGPLCEVGCATIAALVLRFPAHTVRVMASGGPDIIAKILHLHAKISSVQASKIYARCRNSSNVVSL